MIKSLHTLLLSALALPLLAQNYGAPPPPTREPWVHDPVVAWEDSTYHLYCTGLGIGHYTSTDLQQWQFSPVPELTVVPRWALDSVPGLENHLWAPDVTQYRGRWYMAYSCSTFGKNTSAIGLLSRDRLNSREPWHDEGCIVASREKRDEWNAIDPNFVIDADGNPWLTWGSFWDGLQLAPLDTTLHIPAGARPQTIARRYAPNTAEKDMMANPTSKFAGPNAIEAPFIYQRGGWYYLFASWDYCCQGEKSTYRVVVGRSRSVTGPYVDRTGRQMLEGGGTIVVEGDKTHFEAIGHCSVYDLPDGTTRYFSHGYSTTQHGSPILVTRRVAWDSDGWPKLEE